MKTRKLLFSLYVIFLCSTMSMGQTDSWNLTSTMTATLNFDNGVLTISTSRTSEAMPNFDVFPPWFILSLGLRTAVIMNGVTTVGNFTFSNHSSLNSVTIPNTVTSIGNQAFLNCGKLSSLTIPNTVTSIGVDAFAFSGLSTLTVRWTTPLTLSSSNNPFGNLNTSNVTLRVPTGSRGRYQSANIWRNFGTIVEYDPTAIEAVETQTLKAYTSNGILHITGLTSGNPLYIYNLSGQLIYKGIAKSENENIPLNVFGIFIVETGDQRMKIVMN